jgi:hypothetical protein
MPALETSGQGVAFLVSAAVVYDIVAATNSSPQTTEINAAARADTLLKWVNIGTAQAIAFVVVAAAFDRQHRAAILTGGLVAAALLYFQYVHAKNAGLQNGGPPTESYGQAPPVTYGY